MCWKYLINQWSKIAIWWYSAFLKLLENIVIIIASWKWGKTRTQPTLNLLEIGKFSINKPACPLWFLQSYKAKVSQVSWLSGGIILELWLWVWELVETGRIPPQWSIAIETLWKDCHWLPEFLRTTKSKEQL